MNTPTKPTIGLAVFAIAGWFCFWAKSTQAPVTVEKFVTQEVIKYVDKVVKVETKSTETRPDGTTIVTETKSDETTKIDTKTKSTESVITRPVLSKYSLGVSVTTHLSFADLKPTFDYGAEVGIRLWSSPAWATVSYNTKHEVTLGLKYEF